VAQQRIIYEVKGQPTAYFLAECFQTMIKGLVSCVNQREHKQREFLAMMSSTNWTSKNWPQSLSEYPTAFKAGYKSDPVSQNFFKVINREYGEEYQKAMGIEMQALQWVVPWDVVPRSQVPRATNVLPLTWVYKLKHYSYGCPRKFKAQLCVRGDK